MVRWSDRPRTQWNDVNTLILLQRGRWRLRALWADRREEFRTAIRNSNFRLFPRRGGCWRGMHGRTYDAQWHSYEDLELAFLQLLQDARREMRRETLEVPARLLRG